MFSISELTIVAVEDLKAGDFAYIESEQAEAIIAPAPNGDLFAVFLDDLEGDSAASIAALSGFAIAIPKVEFWVDLKSASRSDSFTATPGTLVSSGNLLSLLTSGTTFSLTRGFKVAELDSNESGATVAFHRWKIVKRRGDHIETLFKKELKN